jgi:hypothetical protein
VSDYDKGKEKWLKVEKELAAGALCPHSVPFVWKSFQRLTGLLGVPNARKRRFHMS